MARRCAQQLAIAANKQTHASVRAQLVLRVFWLLPVAFCQSLLCAAQILPPVMGQLSLSVDKVQIDLPRWRPAKAPEAHKVRGQW